MLSRHNYKCAFGHLMVETMDSNIEKECSRCRRLRKLEWRCPNEKEHSTIYQLCLDCLKLVPIDEEKERRRQLEKAKEQLSGFRKMYKGTLLPEMQKTQLALLDEGYAYASSFQASKTFGKDIEKAREYIRGHPYITLSFW